MEPRFKPGDYVRIREDIPDNEMGRNRLYCNHDMWLHRGLCFSVVSSFPGHRGKARYYLKDPEHMFASKWLWDEDWLDSAEVNVKINVASLL